MTGVGALTRTVDDITSKWDEDARATVGTDVQHAAPNEYGTSRMSAQPYLRPSAERAARNIGTIAQQANGTAELVMLAALYSENVAKELVRVDTGELRDSINAQME
jgi:hypothetical protein